MTNGPEFIPREELEQGKEYAGYIATAQGLVREDVARARRGKTRIPVPAAAVPEAPEPNKRRSPQARVESLAQRIQYQTNKYGLSGSVFAEAQRIVEKVGTEGISDDVLRSIQAMYWQKGEAKSFEDCKKLAQLYITQAERERQLEEAKQVTTQSPYVLARGQQPGAPVIREGSK